MKIRTTVACISFAALLLAGLLACEEASSSGGQSPAPEAEASAPVQQAEAAARAAFEAYADAARAGDGDAAAERLHPSYFAWVQTHIDAALDADVDALSALPLMDRFCVLALRMRLDDSTLRTITPEAYTAMGVEKGWVDNTLMAKSTVQSATLQPTDDGQPTRAEVHLLNDDIQVKPPMPMVLHEGRWLLDLLSVMEHALPDYEGTPARMGISEGEFLERALTATEGRSVPEGILNPIGRQ